MHVPSSFLSGFLRAAWQTKPGPSSSPRQRSASRIAERRRPRTLRPPEGAAASGPVGAVPARRAAAPPPSLPAGAGTGPREAPSQPHAIGPVRRQARPRVAFPAPQAEGSPGAGTAGTGFTLLRGRVWGTSASSDPASKFPRHSRRMRVRIPRPSAPGAAPPASGRAEKRLSCLARRRTEAELRAQKRRQRKTCPRPNAFSRLRSPLTSHRAGPRPHPGRSSPPPSIRTRPPRAPRVRERGQSGRDGARRDGLGPAGSGVARTCGPAAAGARCRAGGRVYRRVLMAPRVSQPG